MRARHALARRARAFVDDARLRWASSADARAWDDAQRRAVDALRRCARDHARTERGVYLHGRAGRGKTALADACLMEAAARGRRCARWHFHALLARAHEEASRRSVGASDVFYGIGRDWLFRSAPLVMVDEIEIADVGDATVFKRLMEGYFAAGGTLIGTSNAAPDALYAGGINRQTFAPFVDVLRANCEIVDLDEEGGIDYRRRPGDSSTSAVADVVIVGDDDAARRRLAATWERFRATSGETSDESVGSVDIPVGKTRTIRAMRRIGDRAVWFTFDDLCGRKSRAAPRDYIALAETFSMICVQDVPRMPTSTAENDARRFINLIDVLYERRVVLLTNLAVHSDELFDELGDAARRGRDLSLRERTRAENAASGQLAVTAVGGSSGRSTTMLATDTEWSATGRVGASLADVSAKNFTALAGPRCVSRLAHMARLPDYRPDLLPNFIHVES